MAKQIGNGIVLKISNEDAATTTYALATFDTVGGANAVPIPGSSRPLIDMTDLSDTVRDYVLGIKDMDELSVSFTFDPADAGQTELDTAHGDGNKRWFEITLNDGTTKYYWDGLVTQAGEAPMGIDEKVERQYTVKPTSGVTKV